MVAISFCLFLLNGCISKSVVDFTKLVLVGCNNQ